MKLPRRVLQRLIEVAVQQRLIGATGATSDLALSTRYALTEAGRNAARDALEQSLYIGPAPVSLAAYRDQIEKQRITNEMLDETALRRGLRRAGRAGADDPPIAAGDQCRAQRAALRPARQRQDDAVDAHRRAVQGTRSISPTAVEVAGQIIKVFDAQIHQPRIAEAARRPPGWDLQRGDVGSALGRVLAPGRHDGRRDDARHARSAVQFAMARSTMRRCMSRRSTA